MRCCGQDDLLPRDRPLTTRASGWNSDYKAGLGKARISDSPKGPPLSTEPIGGFARVWTKRSKKRRDLGQGIDTANLLTQPSSVLGGRSPGCQRWVLATGAHEHDGLQGLLTKRRLNRRPGLADGIGRAMAVTGELHRGDAVEADGPESGEGVGEIEAALP